MVLQTLNYRKHLGVGSSCWYRLFQEETILTRKEKEKTIEKHRHVYFQRKMASASVRTVCTSLQVRIWWMKQSSLSKTTINIYATQAGSNRKPPVIDNEYKGRWKSKKQVNVWNHRWYTTFKKTWIAQSEIKHQDKRQGTWRRTKTSWKQYSLQGSAKAIQ